MSEIKLESSIKLRVPHLLGMEDLSKEEIEGILDLSLQLEKRLELGEQKFTSLQGKTVINLFFENSTRTRVSFELAAKRLGADVINISKVGSSAAKSESLYDTAKNISAFNPHIIVVRHECSGAPLTLAKLVGAKVVNAGDGAHEHPTQGLLDMLTIKKRFGGFKGLKVAIVGDITHSRVARSNILGLKKMGATVRLVGPMTMVPRAMESYGVEISHHLVEGIRDVDVIMMLRIQSERLEDLPFPSVREYSKYFGLTTAVLEQAKSDVIIMHPGPVNRGVEISPEVADGPYSLILHQVKNGLYVRMAVLHLLGGVKA